MNRLAITIILVFGLVPLKSQTISIGQPAEEIKTLIEWSTTNHNQADSYGNYSSSRASWDVSYYNGQIIEVLQCMMNQYYINLGMSVNLCKHYMMENGKLAFILTDYENVSKEKLIQAYDKLYNDTKVGDFYFEADFKHYSKIILAKNGHAAIEWKKVDIETFSSSVQDEIKLKKEILANKQIEKEKELKREEEITSKLYDLEELKPYTYEEIKTKIAQKIFNHFTSSEELDSYYNRFKIPKFRDMQYDTEKKYRYNKSFIAHYETGQGSSSEYLELRTITPLTGCDEGWIPIFNDYNQLIGWTGVKPNLKIENYEVNSKADIKIKIDYAKGVTNIKVKNGYFEFTENIPDKDLEEKIRAEILKNISGLNGKFLVKYESYDIMDNSKTTVIIEK